MSSVLRNYRKIYTTPGADPSMPGRVYNLETNEYKVTYYQVVTGTSGTLTVPSGGTINSNEFGLSGNAILSKVDVNGKPTFESPVTSGGSQVTASLNVLTGAWVASGVYTSSSVALIYSIKIKGIDYHNLVYNNIIETVKVTADVSTINLQSVTDGGSNTTHVIETTGYVKTGGTSSQFLKADGSVDSTTYLSTQVVPAGGTTGQILAKVDDTSYNLEWIENYANYTSVLKHTVKAGEAINKGQAVYVSSADGTNMIVSKASNTSEATSSKTMGLLAQTLATNGKGFVITEGLLDNVNTLGATAGDPVWLGISGNLIFGLIGKPYAPAHLVFIGIVTRVSATVGEIFVKVQNGFELKEIHDVDLITTTPINGHILGFNGTLWVNKTIAGWLGYTPYDASNPSGFITSSALTPYLTSATAASTYYPLTNPSAYISGITSSNVTTALGYTPANQDNTILYHTLKYFTTTTTITTSGTTVTTSAAQFTANHIGMKLTILGESRIIASYISSTLITVETAYSTNYSSVASTDWGVYNKMLFISATGNPSLLYYNSVTPVNVTNDNGILAANYQGGNFGFYNGESVFASTYTFKFSSTSSQFGTKDLGYRRNSAGVFEIYDGITATGLLANRRDLLVRNVKASSLTLDLAPFTITGSNNTLQTASTAVAGINYLGGTRQWATGNIGTQNENVWGGVTYSFVGASTITNAYGNVFNAATAGTNATITNNYAAQFNGKVEANLGLETNTLAGLNTAGANLLIVSNNTATKGYISIGNNSAETIYFQSQSFGFSSTVFFTPLSATGFSISRVTPSDTIPNFVMNRSDLGTGIGGTVNTISLITASTTKVKLFNNGNLTIQSGGTFTDNGYRLDVQGTANVLTSLNVGNYATPSAQRIFTVGQDTAFVTIGSIPGATSYGGIWFNQTSQTANNAALYGISTATTLQSPNLLYLRALGTNMITLNQSNISFTPGSFTSGVAQSFTFTNPNNTNQTLSTSIAGWNYNGGTRQWATGAIGTQLENIWGATTYSFVGASTITNAYGNVFNAPIAGTNATITNNWAAQFNGNVVIGSTGQLIEIKQTANNPTFTQTGATSSNISVKSGTRSFSMINYAADANYFQTLGAKFYISTVDAQAIGFSTTNIERLTIGAGGGITVRDNNHFTFEVTNGTKFGTATNQKLSFWNVTPIVQPANTVSLNAVLENTGLMASGSTISTINKPLVVGANTTPRTGVATDGVTSVLGNLQNFTTNYHSGEVLYSEVSGEALNFGQLCYRNAAGKWQKATGSSSAIAAYNMLGICLQTVAGIDTAISILTRGYVETTYLSAGAVGNPLFMDATTAGSITNTAPSTAGNIVRIIGNVFWSSATQTNSKWIVYFNPDNTWIEL
jgi:hypothetical protein